MLWRRRCLAGGLYLQNIRPYFCQQFAKCPMGRNGRYALCERVSARPLSNCRVFRVEIALLTFISLHNEISSRPSQPFAHIPKTDAKYDQQKHDKKEKERGKKHTELFGRSVAHYVCSWETGDWESTSTLCVRSVGTQVTLWFDDISLGIHFFSIHFRFPWNYWPLRRRYAPTLYDCIAPRTFYALLFIKFYFHFRVMQWCFVSSPFIWRRTDEIVRIQLSALWLPLTIPHFCHSRRSEWECALFDCKREYISRQCCRSRLREPEDNWMKQDQTKKSTCHLHELKSKLIILLLSFAVKYCATTDAAVTLDWGRENNFVCGAVNCWIEFYRESQFSREMRIC